MQVAVRNEAYDRVVAGLWARPSLEHFELGELLGHGANAAVLRAMHASGTAVALKVPFPLAPEATTHQLVRYRGDFELLSPVSRLHAPTGGVDSDSWAIHIATFVTTLKVPLDADLIRRIGMQAADARDWGVLGMQALAMVTPLLGPSLKASLDGRRAGLRQGAPLLAPHEWCRLALQLAKGLARCHAQWVVHRDVKPDNVLLRRGLWSTNREGVCPAGSAWCGDDDTLCVLVDFGTCLNCRRGGEGRFLREEGWDGTAAYMAPEVSRAIARGAGAVEYGGQDAWGLGTTLWSMLSPDAAAAPFPGVGDALGCTDARYAPPADVAAAARVPDAYRRAAGRIVRDLLRVELRGAAPRATLLETVARLEVLLFVLLPLPDPAPAARGVLERLPGTIGALREAALRVDAARPRVEELLLVDFAGSERCAPEAVAAVVHDLMG